MIVVLDTNVWISGLLWRGTSNRLIKLLSTSDVSSVVSLELLDELQRVVSNKEKFSSRLMIHDETCESLITAVQEISRLVVVEELPPSYLQKSQLRDPKDAFLFATVIAGGASFLITGDKHLWGLQEYFRICICKPGTFLEEYFMS